MRVLVAKVQREEEEGIGRREEVSGSLKIRKGRESGIFFVNVLFALVHRGVDN